MSQSARSGRREGCFVNKYLDRVIMLLLSSISATVASDYIYRRTFHKRLNLKQPKTFNEKLMWLKLNIYKDNKLVTQCVDKYKVRDYVISLGCEEILNPLIGAWDRADEIPFDTLPQKFVLKCNHGCGYNLICTNKAEFNTEQAKRMLCKWMNEAFWRRFAENNYRKVTKKIICEAFIEDGNRRVPWDYKFYCFNGKAEYVMVCCERNEGKVKYYFFDRKWELVRINPDSIAAANDFTLPEPARLHDMFKYADRLSAPFPFVRVDLYAAGEKIYFGELTFTPAAALDTARLPQADTLFSGLLQIP